ncbi:MAG: PBP1A family penicillin-binding protein [Magnetococcales bacterium]|nr:PBP1A family penicillin-binding protein [Magnetococcales bacterium]
MATPENGRKKGPTSADKTEKKPRKRRWLRFFLLFFVLSTIGGGLYGFAVYMRYSKDLPTLRDLANYHPSLVTRFYSRDYQLLGEFFVERRQFITFKEMPSRLVRAYLAIEDASFYEHFGLNPKGILRAAIANVVAGRVVQGASTITQQVAKTFLLTSERKIKRKIKEAILSLRIEERFTKDEILELYLNQIYLGAGAYGIGAAARIYFNRDVSELSLSQMAMLAGLPKAPSHLNPWRYPKRAKARRALVLKRMVEVGEITSAEAEAALNEELELTSASRPLENIAPHFREHVRRQVQEEWGYRQLNRGGLHVFSTVDPELQDAAQNAVRNGLIDLDRRHGYRGALAQLPSTSEEAQQAWLGEISREPEKGLIGVPGRLGYYQKALVLSVNDKAKAKEAHKKDKPGLATLLLHDGREIFLTFDDVEWARAQTKKRYLGEKIKKVSDVLHSGDVVLVEEETEGGFELAQNPDAEAALVAMDPHTGQIVAMVGGYDFSQSEFNRATQAKRQPGSSFKPIIFAAALDKGYSPVDKVDDSPIPMRYRDADTGELKTWRAENYEHKFYGPTTLRVALEHSRNLVTIRLLKSIGFTYATNYLDQFGLTIPAHRRDLSIALGSVGFTPLDMASAYAILANGGKRIKPVYIARIQDRFGRTVQRHGGGDCLLCHREPKKSPLKSVQESSSHLFGTRVVSQETAYQMTAMLKGVIEHGTGRKAKKLNRALAGKTGTTNDLRDAWFLGYSPSLVVAVWVGRDDSSALGPRETGSKAALPIWIDFMKTALEDRLDTDFVLPPGIHLEAIDHYSGESVGNETKHMILEAFKDGQGPTPRQAAAMPELELDMDGGLY